MVLLLRIDFETNLLNYEHRKWLTTIESPSATIVAMTQVGATSIQSWRKIDTSPSLLGRTSNFKRYIYNVCDIFLFKHASLSFCFDVYFFYNQLYSTSLAMQDLTFASFSKSMIGVRMTKKRSILRRYMV